MPQPKIYIPKRQLEEFCRENHIRKLSLFGSVLHGYFTPDSDVDVLVEFEQGYTPGFIRLARMERQLGAMLGGRKVDLRTPEDLSPYFREEVVSTASVQYAS